MKKRYNIYVIGLFLAALTSCNDWLTIEPVDKLSKDELFSSESGFYDALYGVYTLCNKNYGHNGELMSNFIEHLAAQWTVKTASTEEKMVRHDYASIKQQVSTPFRNQYKAIANINLILEYLEKQGFLTENEYKRLKGECLALRAWLHFDLIRLWGPMPKQDGGARKYLAYVTEFTKDRHEYSSYPQYMEQLMKDMNEAENLLSGLPLDINYRIHYMGIKAIKARALLWQGDKAKALEYAMDIINLKDDKGESKYSLANIININNEDYRFNTEHIFGKYTSFESLAFRNTLYNEEAYLNTLYENSAVDIRVNQWEERIVTGGEASAKNLIKYTNDKEGAVSIVRLAEMYLIAMECAELSVANELYKTFCKARGVEIVQLTSAQHLSAILDKEYRKEFIGEGVLFYYYKRQGTKNIPRNPDVCTEACYVLPIPLEEIDVNA